MKHEIRILLLLYVLIWALAWSAAGRRADASEPDAPPDEPPAAAETAVGGKPDAEVRLRVLHDGRIEEMAMDDYLRGVLRAEMPASFELEALKAQAIAARTYTYYKMQRGPIANHPDADACDDINCCKAYKTASAAAADWGSMALYYEEKLARAVSETDAQAILYDGEPILAVFFSSANGHTQNAAAVWQSDLPYLQSVSSPEDETLVPNYYSVVRVPAEQLREAVSAARPEADFSGGIESWIADVERSDAGFVTTLRVGGVRLKGNELRAMLSLRSPSFTVEREGDAFVFRVTGYGHGVGMSQYGANAMAMQGADAAEIVAHYFTGARVAAYAPALAN